MVDAGLFKELIAVLMMHKGGKLLTAGDMAELMRGAEILETAWDAATPKVSREVKNSLVKPSLPMVEKCS